MTDTALTANLTDAPGEGSGFGGAVLNGGSLEVTGSTLAGNGAPFGAGLFNSGAAGLESSTLSGNGGQYTFARPDAVPKSVSSARGGGIDNSSLFAGPAPPEVDATNVTVSGNSVGQEGGGIYNENAGFSQAPKGAQAPARPTVKLVNATVADNRATQEGEPGPGVFNEPGSGGEVPIFAGLVKAKNTIFALNRQGDTAPVSNCGGQAPESQGHNLEDANTCGLDATPGDGDLVNGDPKLGSLATNGPTGSLGSAFLSHASPPRTHALLDGSAAIDAGDANGCPAKDERGVTRPQRAGCDIGAFERRFPASNPGGPANERPTVGAAGVPRSCAARSTFLLRVDVRGLTRESVRQVDVTVDGRRVKRTTKARFSVRIHVARLSRRRTHTVRVVATDSSGDTARRTRRFARCAAVPRFTG